MLAKALEIRDRATFIPVLAVDMNPDADVGISQTADAYHAQRYLLRRCGHPCGGRPNILLTEMLACGGPANNDPHAWGGRTYPVAHAWIVEHWNEIKDGDVIDVEFILGETAAPKASERLTAQ